MACGAGKSNVVLTFYSLPLLLLCQTTQSNLILQKVLYALFFVWFSQASQLSNEMFVVPQKQ